MDSLYSNVGKKIKGLAIWIFIMNIVSYLIIGIICISNGTSSENPALSSLGVGLIIGSPIASWFSSLLLYGFGELIDKVYNIERALKSENVKSETQERIDSDRIRKIENLRSEGLITEEEYIKALSKGE